MKYPGKEFLNLKTDVIGSTPSDFGFRSLLDEVLSIDLFSNPFTVFGFLWGIPVPVFFLYFHGNLTGESLSTILSNYKIHWFFLVHPFLFALFFGIVGQLYLDYHEELKYRATHDELTELLNHSEFHRIGRNYLSGLNPDQNSIGLVLLDLDHFKKVNDTMGHQKGDEVLESISSQLQSITRDDDYVSRFGGEEFAILLPNTDPSCTHEIAERIRRTVAAAGDEIPRWLTVSAGMASYPEDGTTLDEMITVADEHLYQAKSDGRNRTI